MATNIKQIKVGNELHDLDAKYVDGRAFSEVYAELQGMVHGVVDTYVIPSANSAKTGYGDVVNSTASTLTTTKSILNSLVTPANVSGTYKVGDIILVEAVSNDTTNKGEKAFDRWVSAVSGDTITLSVLETQVATHHHTITTGSAKAIVSVTPKATTNTMAKVGDSVTLLTGTSGSVATSVAYKTDESGKGGHNLAVSAGTSTDGVGHSHTVNSHTHSVTLGHTTLVSQTVSAYTSLSTGSHTPHTHTVVSVASVATSDTSNKITYATTTKSSATFIKTLKDSDDIATGGATPNTDGVSLTTSTQTSADTVGDIVKTTSSGGHSHTLSSAETATVVTSATVASKVITGVTLTNKTTVAANVVTGITYDSTTTIVKGVSRTVTSADYFNSCSVNASGILSFGSAKALTGVTVTATSVHIGDVVSHSSTTQSAAAPTVTLTSASQSVSSGKVAVSGTTNEKGSHQHGFSHTHAIASHSHTVNSHTHTYKKSVADGTENAITAMNTSSYTPHTHTSVGVAGTSTNGNSFTYVKSGTQTNVVANLIEDKAFTSTSSNPGTNTKYYTLTGTITFPGLDVGMKTLSTKSITPAASSGEKPILSVSTSDADFINSVTEKTSENKGGK